MYCSLTPNIREDSSVYVSKVLAGTPIHLICDISRWRAETAAISLSRKRQTKLSLIVLNFYSLIKIHTHTHIFFLMDTSKYPDMISVIRISVLQSLVSCLVASERMCVSSMAVLQCLKWSLSYVQKSIQQLSLMVTDRQTLKKRTKDDMDFFSAFYHSTWCYLFNREFIISVFVTSLANPFFSHFAQMDLPSTQKTFSYNILHSTDAMWIAPAYANPSAIIPLLRHDKATENSPNVSMQTWSESASVSFQYMTI